MTKSIDDCSPAEWNSTTQKFRYQQKESDQYNRDLVDAPPHYNFGNIECIEAIQESMTPEAFKGYCKGNAIKYIWRMSYKGKPLQDLEKAIWYCERLKESELAYPTEPKK